MTDKIKTGKEGERLAATFLMNQGFEIVSRNYRHRRAEIDLIVKRGDWLIFVEVKTRRSHEAGHPADAVDERKQQRLTRLALAYMKRHDLLGVAARFDVVAVTWPADDRRPQIEHFLGAFEAAGGGDLFG